MASLLALLSQQQPNLQTRKGLILTGLQNDFLSPDGKLPVSSDYDYIDHIRELVPAFREHGDVIWVRSQYEADRKVATGINEAGDSVIAGPLGGYGTADDGSNDDGDSPVPCKKARASRDDSGERLESQTSTEPLVSDADEELFLTNTSEREACCIKGTPGAEFAAHIKDIIDRKDLQVTKTCYSAFGSTSLLLTLRSKLITELFVGGNMTNLSVFATAMDAARYGIKITLLEDCLGYRNKARHEAAIKTLKDVVGADVVTAAQAIEHLKNPPEEEYSDEEEEEDDEEVAFGEDASGIPVHTLHVDDHDDRAAELEMPSNVRPRFTSSVEAPAASSAFVMNGLPGLSPGQDTPIEPGSTPHASVDALRVTHFQSADDGSATGKPNNDLKPELDRTGAVGTGGLKVDESSERVRRPASMSGKWVSDIDAEWAKKNENNYGRIARSTHPGLGAMAAVVGLDQGTVDEYEAMMKAFRDANTEGEVKTKGQPLFGEDKEEESAGSRIFYDLVPTDLAETIFDKLNEEVTWQRMHHQMGEVPRLVCCQGTIGADGSMPVYRHPSDQTLPLARWTPTVDLVREAAEEIVGHPLNHALIQLYRGGTDFISEHSDKTLDIATDSSIVNVSFGAQRTMRLRTKRGAKMEDALSSPPAPRTTYRVPLPHNSMVTMSLNTNAAYLHGINADKRPHVELTEAEKAFAGQRISLTFRRIATFLDENSTRVWGQGATGKEERDAKPVVNGDVVESERLVKAFGRENQASGFDWGGVYGRGSDVLHLK